MQRCLIVMRHAKSSWNSDAQTDHARPLNARGRRDAPRVAERLVEQKQVPQFVLSSDSQRTRETCQLLTARWEEGVEVEFLPSLYHAGAAALRHELPRVSDEVEILLVVGHNPGWEEVVHRLSNEVVTMKTGTAALLQGKCDSWTDAFGAPWSIREVIYPRELE